MDANNKRARQCFQVTTTDLWKDGQFCAELMKSKDMDWNAVNDDAPMGSFNDAEQGQGHG